MNRLLLAVAAGLALSGCSDARRPVARAYLEANPPAGFAVVAVPGELSVAPAADGASEATAIVRYRSLRATVEIRDGFTLPRAAEIAGRLTALRGWALATLPAEDPARAAILHGVAASRAPFPVKRVVTAAGTELEAVATLQLRKTGGAWQVTAFRPEAAVPGAPDADAGIPLDDSPAVAARLNQLEATTRQLEATRREYLAARQRAAARSLASLQAALRTGRTFEGRLPGGLPIRLVISRGLEAAPPVVAVLTVQGEGASAARFSGGLVPRPSGEMIFHSTQVVTLSVASETALPAATNAAARPVLSLSASPAGLVGQLETAGRAPTSLALRPGPPADLIPDIEPPGGLTP